WRRYPYGAGGIWRSWFPPKLSGQGSSHGDFWARPRPSQRAKRETKNRAHRQKVDDPGTLEIAEQHGESLQLHWLPDCETRQHRDKARKDPPAIEEALHRIVNQQI